jgi:hypothetical protein
METLLTDKGAVAIDGNGTHPTGGHPPVATVHLQNPRHELPAHMQRALDERRAGRLEALATKHRIAMAARPTAEKQALLRAHPPKLTAADESVIKSLRKGFRERIRDIELPHIFADPLSPADVAPPLPVDNTMWWAHTNGFTAGGIQAAFESDGLHFFGEVDYDSDPLFSFGLGAWATFELQPERRQVSASGRYYSAPYVELFGAINGWANLQFCPWACDDKWSKCWMFLRQSAIQFVDDQGTWQLCGENTEWRQLIYLDGDGNGQTAALPGYLPMPALQFGLLRPDRTLLIDLEVSFHIQLEGSSYIGFSPGNNSSGSVVLRYFQWPVFPA